MTNRAVILAVAGALALAGQPALASGRGGGGRSGGGRSGGGHSGGAYSRGGHSGGGHSGGGYAVPRGSGSHYVPRGVAAARHPSGGSGYYGGHGSYGHGSYGHGGYYGHSYGYGHGHYGYGSYYPYYPYYGYGGYYGSGFGLYLGFGGPYAYGSMYYGSPYAYGYPSESTNVYVGSPDAGSDDPGYRRPADARVSGDYVPNTGRVRLEVRPEDASVYVDDQFWGTASESRQLTLRAGRHMIELVRPGFPVARREVDVISGQSSDVLVDLQQQQQ